MGGLQYGTFLRQTKETYDRQENYQYSAQTSNQNHN